jgi:hypothetical protein
MARPSKKTKLEIAQDLAAKAARAMDAAKLAEVEGNPLLKPIVDALDETNREIAGHSRKLTGPQSFENRRRLAALRSTWIEREADYIKAANVLANARRDYFHSEMAETATRIADGTDIPDAEEIAQIVENAPKDENLPALMLAVSEANAAWRDFSAGLKAGASEENASGD